MVSDGDQGSDQQSVNQAYRCAIMATIELDGTPKIDGFKRPDGSCPVTAVQDPNGMHKLRIEMPDGTTEYWRQIAETRTTTEFRASAFERFNNDEQQSLYVEEGGPETCVVFPGSQKIGADRETALKIVKGGDMSWRFEEAQEFMGSVARYVERRAEQSEGTDLYGEHGHGYGSVMLGSHSMGVYGLVPAIQTTQDLLSIEPEAVAVAPLGGTQAARMFAEYSGIEPDQNAVDALTSNVASFRPNLWTIFSELQTGPETGGNDMIGEGFSYTPDVQKIPLIGGPQDSFLGSEFKVLNVMSHETSAFVNGICARGAESVEPRAIFDAGHESLDWDYEGSIANTERFNAEVGGLVDLKNTFNSEAKPITQDMFVMVNPDEPGFKWADEQMPETGDAPDPAVVASVEAPKSFFGSIMGR